MKKNKLLILIIAIILTASLSVFSLSPTVCAILSKNGSITLHVADSNTGEPMENASFRLYFIAAAYEQGNGVIYEFLDPYDSCNMDISNLQDAYLPIHLTHFAFSNELSYTVKKTDDNGMLVFEDLYPGLYLVVPMGDIPHYYVPSPFVVNIPVFDYEHKDWNYDINATPKIKAHEVPLPDETTYITVRKLWDTDETPPESISVSLLCDFKEAEKVTLSEENGWYYRWDNLSVIHTWSVVENEVPPGYTVYYDASSNTVIITNKKDPPQEPPTTAPEDDTTSPEESTTTPSEPTTKPDELIDTGQLNWPIPLLSVSGLLLFSIGWAMLNLGKKEDTGEE